MAIDEDWNLGAVRPLHHATRSSGALAGAEQYGAEPVTWLGGAARAALVEQTTRWG